MPGKDRFQTGKEELIKLLELKFGLCCMLKDAILT